ncbi:MULTISPECIES: amino acid adenylation domain-containing protein [Streptomyces]|uniref:Amino acid adenylation domain-containing protein n=1 Tax=Streptomyces doudnae TaxID=3075536 RepID=A0ABD5EG26_9ACTN|nr:MULTISPECIES: amino acid adenylation domain-containing protein [unclassified Streptomyces]MDT0433586.1 amino acid adenylation domain-containing protein [Streptomyces sp. DSM 41981]MYQ67491.1 amino acid adenylation domain-containing protein [Streptomyces sp. SID4950]SCE35767.1 amino acid adenylation domain-containing protein [Streptomyces sp. SolWspMP-5a-2]
MVTIDAAFRRWAVRTPDAVALRAPRTRLTYGELDRAATRLARALLRLGVGPGELVGVAATPSPEFVVAALAVLRAGCAYLPLDLAYPEQRLAHMRRDSGVRVVVSSPGAALPPALADCVRLDPAADTGPDDDADALPAAGAAEPGDLAYAMYTSGSTGLPKAVLVEQRNVTAFALRQDFAALGPGRSMLQSSSFSFDASVLEIWGVLLRGACLVFPPEALLSPAETAEVLARERVTDLWLSSGLFHRIAEDAPEAFAPLRTVITGGDVVSPPRVRRVLSANPGLTVAHIYGPTETTVAVCRRLLTHPDQVESPLPLGTPIPGTSLHVMDERGRPVPAGETGELWIAGETVSRGYHDRPALTAERYVTDPGTGRRAYRSGDLARKRPDGTVEFAGRADQQVKIRGFRVEPGEIEAALGEAPGVHACLVSPRVAPPGDKRVVAYVVPAAAGPLRAAEVHRFLAGRLPRHMLPSEYVALDALPLDANGKEDRRRLPEPSWGRGSLAVLDVVPAPAAPAALPERI